MTELIYEAAVYTRTVSYRNFKGVEQKVELFFALDPLQLLSLIAGFKPTNKGAKSGNPARKNELEFDEGAQVAFVRDLAVKAAGTPSDDGESWEPFEDFGDSLAGKAFLTKLAASDGDREEFAQKVIMDPFRAFVQFAAADPSNTKKDIQQFNSMLDQLEKLFSNDKADESVEDRRARLEAEMAALNAGSE